MASTPSLCLLVWLNLAFVIFATPHNLPLERMKRTLCFGPACLTLQPSSSSSQSHSSSSSFSSNIGGVPVSTSNTETKAGATSSNGGSAVGTSSANAGGAAINPFGGSAISSISSNANAAAISNQPNPLGFNLGFNRHNPGQNRPGLGFNNFQGGSNPWNVLGNQFSGCNYRFCRGRKKRNANIASSHSAAQTVSTNTNQASVTSSSGSVQNTAGGITTGYRLGSSTLTGANTPTTGSGSAAVSTGNRNGAVAIFSNSNFPVFPDIIFPDAQLGFPHGQPNFNTDFSGGIPASQPSINTGIPLVPNFNTGVPLVQNFNTGFDAGVQNIPAAAPNHNFPNVAVNLGRPYSVNTRGGLGSSVSAGIIPAGGDLQGVWTSISSSTGPNGQTTVHRRGGIIS